MTVLLSTGNFVRLESSVGQNTRWRMIVKHKNIMGVKAYNN